MKPGLFGFEVNKLGSNFFGLDIYFSSCLDGLLAETFLFGGWGGGRLTNDKDTSSYSN